MSETDAFLRVLPLVKSVVRQYIARGLDPDEAESEAQLAALAAIRRYDPAKGRLRSIVYSYVTHALQGLATVARRRQNATINLDCDVCDPRDRQRQQVEELLELLSPVERTVIVALYYDGKKEEEVATSLSRSRQTINRIKREALAKMRGAMTDGSATG